MPGSVSAEVKQVRVAGPEPSFCNMTASAGRIPSDTTMGGMSWGGLHCSEPEFKANIGLARDTAVRNRFFTSPPQIESQPGDVSFGLYLRACGAAAFTDPMFLIYNAMFGKKADSNLSYTVSAWDSTTQVTLVSASGLAAGQGFAFVCQGVSFVRFITNVAGAVITFTPANPSWVDDAKLTITTIHGGRTYATAQDFAADSTVMMDMLTGAYRALAFGCQGSKFDLALETGKMATAKVTMASAYLKPNETIVAVDATAEPAGPWLKFLNGTCVVNGVETAVRDVTWGLDFAPILVKNPNNGAGGNSWTMSAPVITAKANLSVYDNTMLTKLTAGTTFDLLTSMGAGTGGSAVALYCPKMHLAEVPLAAEADNSIILPVSLEAALYTGDSGSFDNSTTTSLVDTLFRMFFERGA